MQVNLSSRNENIHEIFIYETFGHEPMPISYHSQTFTEYKRERLKKSIRKWKKSQRKFKREKGRR